MTQKERLLNYLKRHGRINPLQSWQALGIYRLSAVILDLRKEGYDIETLNTPVSNQFGEKVHVATYVLHDDFGGFRSASAILENIRQATAELKEANDRHEQQ